MIADFLRSQSYRDGYEKALIDVENWFKRHSLALKWCKMYNQKNIEMLLSAIRCHADIFQEYGDDTEISFEHEKNKIKKITVARI